MSLDAIEGAAGPDRFSMADPHGANPEQRAICRELEVAIAEALAELPLIQRAIVELRSLGHPLAEVSEMLELSPVNTRVLLHRARRTLANRLRPFIEDQVT